MRWLAHYDAGQYAVLVLYFCHAISYYVCFLCVKYLHLLSLFFHHADPKTGEDELITPKDPDLDEEIKQLPSSNIISSISKSFITEITSE